MFRTRHANDYAIPNNDKVCRERNLSFRFKKCIFSDFRNKNEIKSITMEFN